MVMSIETGLLNVKLHFKMSSLHYQLPPPDFSKPFKLACGYGLGGVLYEGGHLVAYESRKLSAAELNHHTTEQEMLAVIHSLKVWRCYLEGALEFEVETGHNTFFETAVPILPADTVAGVPLQLPFYLGAYSRCSKCC